MRVFAMAFAIASPGLAPLFLRAATSLYRWSALSIACTVLLLTGCAGDEAFLKTAPGATGLLVVDAGIYPSDPDPLEESVAFALVRDAERVVLRLAEADGDSLEAGRIDSAARSYARIELDAVEGEGAAGTLRQWETALPARGEGHAWLYWFEAFAGDQVVAFPAEGPGSAIRMAARTFDLDFEWPGWPPLSVELPCLGEPSRVWDGAEDEATLAVAPDFLEISQPIWSSVTQQTVMANSEAIMKGAGVEIGGQAYFFPLAVLLWNEVSNQSIGGMRTAMSYCPLTDTAVHFDTGFDPQHLPKFHNFEPSGLFNSNVLVSIRGPQNPTSFSQMLGFGIQGARSGECLNVLPSIMIDYQTWVRLHPDTLVLEGDVRTAADFQYVSRVNPYRDYWRSNVELRAPVARTDSRFELKRQVLVLMLLEDPVVVPLGSGPFVHHTQAAGLDVVIFHHGQAAVALERRHPLTGETLRFTRSPLDWRGTPLYRDDSAESSLWTFEGVALGGPAKGHRLPWVPSMSGFWFAWYAIYPESRVEIPGS
jgi:hypothetical protein